MLNDTTPSIGSAYMHIIFIAKHPYTIIVLHSQWLCADGALGIPGRLQSGYQITRSYIGPFEFRAKD